MLKQSESILVMTIRNGDESLSDPSWGVVWVQYLSFVERLVREFHI